MSEPKISLCMIAKNEAPVLRRCLDAAREAVDEIILVDTGSTDETAAIAASCGAKVFHHPWNDDFSQARNRSLDHATGDWILWLDADEVLQPGGGKAIRKAVCDREKAVYLLSFTNILDEGKQTHYLMPRLFLRRPEIRFVNVIHEQILGPAESYAKKNGLQCGVCEARVLHFGYSESEMQRKGKVEKYQKLFEKQLRQTPDDPYSWYKYGDFVRKRIPEEGIHALQRSIELIDEGLARAQPAPIYAPEVSAILATELQNQGREQEALDALGKVFSWNCQPTPNYLFAKACVSKGQGKLEQAAREFASCLELKQESYSVPVQWGIRGPLAWYGVAECLAGLGKHADAEFAYDEAIHLAPSNAEIALSRATHLLRQGKAIQTVEALANYLATDPPASELWPKYGKPLLELALRGVERGMDSAQKPSVSL